MNVRRWFDKKKNKMQDLKSIAAQIRRDIVRMVHGVQSRHPGGLLAAQNFLPRYILK